jgi:hypothetical protein
MSNNQWHTGEQHVLEEKDGKKEMDRCRPAVSQRELPEDDQQETGRTL